MGDPTGLFLAVGTADAKVLRNQRTTAIISESKGRAAVITRVLRS